jgi:hypothetical protein
MAAYVSFSGMLKLVVRSSPWKILMASVCKANTIAIHPKTRFNNVKMLGTCFIGEFE